MQLAVIFLVLAAVFAVVLACCVLSSWWSRKEEREESCRKCPANIKGRCDCLRKKEDPCDKCWEKAYKLCEGCHRRKIDGK